MAEQILVPLKSNDRLEEIIPYIEEIAKPGMKAVFLVRYPVDGLEWLRDHWVTMESPREAMLAGRKIMEKYSLEEQGRLAKQKCFPVCEPLRKRGVEVAVDVYTGSLKKVVDSFTRNGDSTSIMMQAGWGFRLMSFLRRTTPLFGLLRPRALSAVLLLHLHHGI